MQVYFIAAAYAVVVALAAFLLIGRYLQEITHPADVAAAGGMYGAGDAILYIFIACLFMIPTVFLVRFMARFEAIYTTYSRLLLGLSLSAPLCLSLLYFGQDHVGENVAGYCLFRLLWAPFILFGIGISWWVARFDRAKRFTSYAFLVEGLTMGGAVAALFIHRR